MHVVGDAPLPYDDPVAYDEAAAYAEPAASEGPGAQVEADAPQGFVAPYPNEPLGFSGARLAQATAPAVAPAPAAAPESAPEPVEPGQPSSFAEQEYYEPSADEMHDGPMPHGYDDPDAPAPAVSSGEWVRDGFWYTQQSAVYMDRSTNVKNSTILATDFEGAVFEHDNPFLQIPVGLGYQPGLRSTLGRYIGRDCRNRDHAIEFTYLGLTHWGAAGSLTSITGSGIFTNIDASFATAFGVPAFNSSSEQSFDITSDFNSWELNYRIERRLSRDRLIYTRDSCWVRQATPALLPSLIAGIRVVTVNEHLSWFAEDDNPPTSTGSYFVTTHNNLVGPQIGFDVFYERADWRLGFRMKGAAVVNWDSESSHVRILDANGDPLVPNRDEFAKDHDAAFVGEMNIIGVYHLKPRFALRVSYDLMWVTNLALAQNQLTFNPSTPPYLADAHSLFFQGLSLGFEYSR